LGSAMVVKSCRLCVLLLPAGGCGCGIEGVEEYNRSVPVGAVAGALNKEDPGLGGTIMSCAAAACESEGAVEVFRPHTRCFDEAGVGPAVLS